MAEQLSIQSARFITTDFLDYQPDAPFDACSASPPRTISSTRGSATRCSRSSRAGSLPAADLILYGPRRREEVPVFVGLPAPFEMREVFAPDDLSRFCAGAGLEVETLTAAVHRMGTLAKQIRRLAGSSAPARALAYPIELALVGLDGIGSPVIRHRHALVGAPAGGAPASELESESDDSASLVCRSAHARQTHARSRAAGGMRSRTPAGYRS